MIPLDPALKEQRRWNKEHGTKNMWWKAVSLLMLIQPNSAAVERVFSTK